jgi:glutamate synthase domain-containing protein 2
VRGSRRRTRDTPMTARGADGSRVNEPGVTWMSGWDLVGLIVAVLVIVVVIYDLTQRRRAVLRNFPVIGHFRYILEGIGPELRQYIVTGNDDERPFSRNQRRWVYASAKRENNTFGFGTDTAFERNPGYLIIRHAEFPEPEPTVSQGPEFAVPCAKVLGGPRGRRSGFRPPSIVNVSGMSFGALSGAAVTAINRGVRIAGCLQNTGEGGIAPHHLHGGDLVFQIGTAYFGCNDGRGNFSLERLVEVCAAHPVRAIEIKLSQGAKPGVGGLLPAKKVTPEIAAARGVPAGVACQSPSRHSAFGDVDSLLEFVEVVADATGLPVGIKSAVGESAFWEDLAESMTAGDRGVDFIVVDGGEGGSGAAPLVFADHVALPYVQAQAVVYRAFAIRGIAHRVVFIASGRRGLPETSLLAFGLGADMISVGREAMLSIGCIQAQRCHTGRCPTGVATQSAWLQRGLDPDLKSVRLANYICVLRHEIAALSRTCGAPHPAFVTLDHFAFLDGTVMTPASERFDLLPGWCRPALDDLDAIAEIMRSERVAGSEAHRAVG